MSVCDMQAAQKTSLPFIFLIKKAIKKIQPCPSTSKPFGACPGYIIDHIIPLKRGGMDAPSNMQWQTVEESKEKDKWE